MKALINKLLYMQPAAPQPDPVYGVLETIEAMSDDERILLYENGIVYILWLREKNPSLLAIAAADIRERLRGSSVTDPG